MKRQTLDDGTWFDLEAAKAFEEHTWFDGSNHRSVAGKHEHEKLFRTAGGQWVLNHWSEWQGSHEAWTVIDAAAAARWLSLHQHDSHPACATEFAALEVK